MNLKHFKVTGSIFHFRQLFFWCVAQETDVKEVNSAKHDGLHHKFLNDALQAVAKASCRSFMCSTQVLRNAFFPKQFTVRPFTNLSAVNSLHLSPGWGNDVSPFPDLSAFNSLHLSPGWSSDVRRFPDFGAFNSLHLSPGWGSDVRPFPDLSAFNPLHLSPGWGSDVRPFPDFGAFNSLHLSPGWGSDVRPFLNLSAFNFLHVSPGCSDVRPFWIGVLSSVTCVSQFGPPLFRISVLSILGSLLFQILTFVFQFG